MKRDDLQAILEALESAAVFTSPLERLRGWSEYKEDAARRIAEAKETLRKELGS